MNLAGTWHAVGPHFNIVIPAQAEIQNFHFFEINNMINLFWNQIAFYI
jgi:hypothetical protein